MLIDDLKSLQRHVDHLVAQRVSRYHCDVRKVAVDLRVPAVQPSVIVLQEGHHQDGIGHPLLTNRASCLRYTVSITDVSAR